MTQPCRHRWGAWSPAWHEPGHGWWRKRTCHDCGREEHIRVHAAEPDTATWYEDGRDMGDEQR